MSYTLLSREKSNYLTRHIIYSTSIVYYCRIEKKILVVIFQSIYSEIENAKKSYILYFNFEFTYN